MIMRWSSTTTGTGLSRRPFDRVDGVWRHPYAVAAAAWGSTQVRRPGQSQHKSLLFRSRPHRMKMRWRGPCLRGRVRGRPGEPCEDVIVLPQGPDDEVEDVQEEEEQEDPEMAQALRDACFGGSDRGDDSSRPTKTAFAIFWRTQRLKLRGRRDRVARLVNDGVGPRRKRR